MTSTFAWCESTGSVTCTGVPTNLNFGSSPESNLNPATYQISAGSYSYEKWVRAHFSGSFTSISNIKFWASTCSYVTGEQINATGEVETYATPVVTVSSYATTAVPTSSPTNANVGISGTTSASITSAGYTDYIVMQASISAAASSGATTQKQFSLSYDET